MKHWNRLTSMAMIAAIAVVLLGGEARATTRGAADGTRIGNAVKKELNRLPFITVFDEMDYEVTGDTVRLTGHVTRPLSRSGAEALVKKIEGVNTVINEIDVLPLSRFDDRIRASAYRQLFHLNSPLLRYAVGGNGSVRIIVRNGHITLTGFVVNEMDRKLAEIAMRQVPDAFTATNKLKIG